MINYRINVLSLFDGIGCARLAIENTKNIKINRYYFSEIEKNCVELNKKKFPNNIYLGDVSKINLDKLPKIDLLIGGSPCQDLSNAHKGNGLDGMRSSLFYKFVEIKNKLKPKFFILENVKNNQVNLMNKHIGIEGEEINSIYFSAQNRPRVYWTNIKFDHNFNKEKKIFIKNVIDRNVSENFFLKSSLELKIQKLELFLDTKKNLNKKDEFFSIKKIITIPRSIIKDNERQRRVYSIHGKSPTLLARSDSPKILINGRIRKLTPTECERLQTIPAEFTKDYSNTTRYKMVGNAFTVEVIKYILSFYGNKKNEQLKLIN